MTPRRITPIVCPLCPLHCDDVRIDGEGVLEANGCPIVAASSPVSIPQPDRGDIAVSRKRLGPLRVVTTGVDLTIARQLSRWHAAGRVDLVIESDPSVEALLQTASRDGIVSATLADVATHADLVWLIGRVDEAWPRFAEKLRLERNDSRGKPVRRFERCTADEMSHFAAAQAARLCGNEPPSNSTLHPSPGTLERSEGKVEPEASTRPPRPEAVRLSQGEGKERRVASAREEPTRQVSSLPTGGLAGHVDEFLTSQYSAILIGPGAFARGEESLSATMLARLVRLRNATNRSVLVTLDAAATLRSVCLWSSNASPETTVDGSGEVGFDCRLGSPLDIDSPPAQVQIGGVDPGPDRAGAYRACSVAGLHRPGMVIRGDGSVSLPLAAPLAAPLPNEIDWLDDCLTDEFWQ